MIKLIYIPLLVFASLAHSAPLSWPLDAVAQIQRAKTVKDMTCASHQSVASRELCELFIMDHSLKKNLNIETINDSTLMMKSGSLSVKLERTDEPMQFMINGQMIDLKKYPNQERLGFALEAALRPHEAVRFQLIDEAYAADEHATLKAGVQSLLVLVQQDGNCVAYKQFIDSCMDGTEPILDYFKRKGADFRDPKNKNMQKAIKDKLKDISLQLAKVNGAVDARYSYASNCDCRDNANQVSCGDEAKSRTKSVAGIMAADDHGQMRDKNNMTEPRQKGFDRCTRFIQEVDRATEITDGISDNGAKKLLAEIEQTITGIKAEAPKGTGDANK